MIHHSAPPPAGSSQLIETMLLPAAAAPPSRDDRLTTILLVARLSTGSRDELCRIRNISSGGMRIETLSPVSPGERVSIELKNRAVVDGVVVWVDPPGFGLRFDHSVDMVALLAGAALPLERPRSRISVRLGGSRRQLPLRLSARCPVVLRRYGHVLSGILEDIAQGGARVSLTGAAVPGDHIRLVIPGLESRRATVACVADGTVELIFAEPVAFADLSLWLAGKHRFSSASAAPVSPPPQSS
jgi:hypothetical protein